MGHYIKNLNKNKLFYKRKITGYICCSKTRNNVSNFATEIIILECIALIQDSFSSWLLTKHQTQLLVLPRHVLIRSLS